MCFGGNRLDLGAYLPWSLADPETFLWGTSCGGSELSAKVEPISYVSQLALLIFSLEGVYCQTEGVDGAIAGFTPLDPPLTVVTVILGLQASQKR